MKYILIIEKCFLLSLLLLTLVGCDNNVYHWEFRYDYEQIMEIKIIEFDDDVLFDDSNIVEISEFKYKFIKNVDCKLFKEITDGITGLEMKKDYRYVFNYPFPYGVCFLIVYHSGEYEVISQDGPAVFIRNDESKMCHYFSRLCFDENEFSDLINKYL